MSKFSVRLRELRDNAGWTQQLLADKVGISKSSINMYERGAREPSIETLESIADCFNVDMDYLLGKSEHKNKYAWLNSVEEKQVDLPGSIRPIAKKTFPLLGEIACGAPIFAAEDKETYVEADSEIKADFCLICKGDSMINAQIEDGDIVFIRQQSSVDNGQIAAVVIEDEVTLKRVSYSKDKNVLVLKAENPAYEDFVFSQEDLEHIRIIGRAVIVQKEIDKRRNK